METKRIRDKEKLRTYAHTYQNKHRDAINARCRKRYRDKHAEIRLKVKVYRQENRDRLNEQQRIYYQSHGRYRDPALRKAAWQATAKKLREDVFRAYGDKCACCGEANWEFLTIDHINGRKAVGHSRNITGERLWRLLRRQNFPRDEYRLLCINCNFSLGMRGYCPHQKVVGAS
jgi:hypothetical protein